MRLLGWMVGISWISWLPMAILSDRQTSLAIMYGMMGSLAVVCATWLAIERTYRQRPEAMTAVMVACFAGKFLFVMAYVTVMLRVLSLRPLPFAVSFTTYFIVLYFIVALRLWRLLWSGMRP